MTCLQTWWQGLMMELPSCDGEARALRRQSLQRHSTPREQGEKWTQADGQAEETGGFTKQKAQRTPCGSEGPNRVKHPSAGSWQVSCHLSSSHNRPRVESLSSVHSLRIHWPHSWLLVVLVVVSRCFGHQSD